MVPPYRKKTVMSVDIAFYCLYMILGKGGNKPYGSNNALMPFLTFRHNRWEISPPFMKLNEKIGEGAFGFVYNGSVHKNVYNRLPCTKLHPNKSLISGKKNKVAVKLVKGKAFVFPYHCYF